MPLISEVEEKKGNIVPAPEGSAWVVVYVRPRREKKLVDICGLQQIASFLPVRPVEHRYGKRKRIFNLPLFPGYLFCVTTEPQIFWLRQNQNVVRVLLCAEQEKLVRQLQQIEQALAQGIVIEVLPFLVKGKAVRVKSGSMKGQEGIVLCMKGKTRVVFNVDMLGQSVSTEIDAALLEPA